jgi:hypothetical protein
MRIDNSYLTSPAFGEMRGAAATEAPAEKGETRSDAVLQPGGHVPSPELAYYRELLQVVPDTRPALLDGVAQRLGNGYYASAHAALLTAQAILQAAD